MLDYTNDKYALLKIKPKCGWFMSISFILSIFLLIMSIYINTYDSYKYTGIVLDNKIMININVKEINKILKSDYIKINNKKDRFSVLSVSDIQYDEQTLINYHTVIISTSNSYIDNLSLDVTFYNNKQRIITKVINLLK